MSQENVEIVKVAYELFALPIFRRRIRASDERGLDGDVCDHARS
jgi:hypothetical protein